MTNEDLILDTRDRDARIPADGSAWLKAGALMFHIQDYGTGVAVTAYKLETEPASGLEVAGESLGSWSLPDGREEA